MAKDKTQTDGGRPAKRTKLLDDEDESSASGGEEVGFKINEEFARRFEHNKKREERQRLEEKYGNDKEGDDEDEESSSDEDEDDDAMLATEALDAEISATLNAIRSKDPRVYDAGAKFYSDWNPENLPTTEKQEKPVTLRDYHRQNLMEGKITGDEDEDEPALPYAQEQAALKKELASATQADESEDEGEDDFLVAKDKPKKDEAAASAAPSAKPKRKVELDVENADKDPENFLSNFLASRAWTLDTDKFAPLESDSDSEDRRADEFEMAYNMRFEDPATANEKLQTFARDAVAKASVRREEKSTRQKQRDKERERKEAIKREREEDKARLRKLKIEEMEEKLNMIKEAAGLSGKEFNLDDWRDVLDADWDDDRWDQEMQKRFGDNYYDEKEGAVSDSDEDGVGKKKKKSKKPKKPTWDDDIDIKDIIPDFEDEEEAPALNLSGGEDEEDGGVQLPNGEADESDEETVSKKKKKSKKNEIDAKHAARRERRIIESLVDQNIEVDLAAKQTESGPARFRYRETSPTTFGLTARDILLADDAQLNQFAGLKKMATWREPEKKKKDKKKLGKKARLREWRKETFGDEEGPKYGFSDYVTKKYNDHGLPIQAPVDVQAKSSRDDGVDIREGSKKKKRGKKRKAGIAEE
ncbi:ribosome biogenesis protein kri1 [Diplodia corticola]|uniref:Ribosome biogenesis protein kri1 n=1 Tax=Diplodia corticola TaxID=236234 RepID=A0A1J9R4G1_9PEZI|nr:ribosome biogenesis protein kri1 [Diplodia corticola]OJD36350.1 ribosome biogenesis protein kri1 [Diplodia corticola]